jgi:metal-dependent amidase/aminoacylase/carboxypeptidase family protein
MTDLRTELKALVRREIEQNLATLTGISDRMYHNPEIGLQEFQPLENSPRS